MSNRFHTEQELPATGESLLLDPDESHHLLKVMRIRTGTRIRVFGLGREAWATVIGSAGKTAEVRIDECCHPPAPPRLGFHAVIPWLRGGKTEWAAQKLTELGVRSTRLYHARREVVHGSKDKLDRMRRVVIDACKQCERADVPAVTEADSVGEAVSAGWPNSSFRVLLHERSGGRLLGDALRQLQSAGGFPGDIVCASGPEGGFDPAELEFGGAPPEFVSLGPRILRADTAPLVAMSIALTVGNEL
jgi:16S rRNA (uracil1498-N3)-methyltransferase